MAAECERRGLGPAAAEAEGLGCRSKGEMELGTVARVRALLRGASQCLSACKRRPDWGRKPAQTEAHVRHGTQTLWHLPTLSDPALQLVLSCDTSTTIRDKKTRPGGFRCPVNSASPWSGTT